jgi:hypothetical protein
LITHQLILQQLHKIQVQVTAVARPRNQKSPYISILQPSKSPDLRGLFVFGFMSRGDPVAIHRQVFAFLFAYML